MDPLSIILTAVVTGAAMALKPMTEQAIKDAYAGLKKVIQDKYGNEDKVDWGIKSLDKDPESAGGQGLLKEGLEAAGADQDEELVKEAQALLDKLKAQPGGEQYIKQVVKDSIGVAQATGGGTATVTIGKVPEKKEKK